MLQLQCSSAFTLKSLLKGINRNLSRKNVSNASGYLFGRNLLLSYRLADNCSTRNMVEEECV